MPPALINGLNWFILGIILVGIPSMATIDLGRLRIADSALIQSLCLAGCLLAGCVNMATGRLWLHTARQRKPAVRWMVIHWLFAALFGAMMMNWISFRWLREGLLNLKKTSGW